MKDRAFFKCSPTILFLTVKSCWVLMAVMGLSMVASGQSSQNAGLGPFRVQSISLQAGWNAVYLEVEPRNGLPDELFAGTPIEIVAAYNRPVTSMQFIESPSQVLPDRRGWNVWYAPQREDSLLSNLGAIQAHNSYLVYTETAYTWSMEGTPFFGGPRWHPNAFSLVGFPIDAVERPTMANFFAGIKEHQPLQIYRMSGGQWTRVTNPQQTLMTPGAAYWVYSKGASKFAGPLSVQFDGKGAGGLFFNDQSGSQELEIRNLSSFPQELTVTIDPGNAGKVPLAFIIRALDGPDAPMQDISIRLEDGQRIGPIEPGAAFRIGLEVVQELVTTALLTSSLKISSDAGPMVEIPVVSIRPDLAETP